MAVTMKEAEEYRRKKRQEEAGALREQSLGESRSSASGMPQEYVNRQRKMDRDARISSAQRQRAAAAAKLWQNDNPTSATRFSAGYGQKNNTAAGRLERMYERDKAIRDYAEAKKEAVIAPYKASNPTMATHATLPGGQRDTATARLGRQYQTDRYNYLNADSVKLTSERSALKKKAESGSLSDQEQKRLDNVEKQLSEIYAYRAAGYTDGASISERIKELEEKRIHATLDELDDINAELETLNDPQTYLAAAYRGGKGKDYFAALGSIIDNGGVAPAGTAHDDYSVYDRFSRSAERRKIENGTFIDDVRRKYGSDVAENVEFYLSYDPAALNTEFGQNLRTSLSGMIDEADLAKLDALSGSDDPLRAQVRIYEGLAGARDNARAAEGNWRQYGSQRPNVSEKEAGADPALDMTEDGIYVPGPGSVFKYIADGRSGARDDRRFDDEFRKFDYMTDDQVDTYLWIAKTQGAEKAYSYIDALSWDLNSKYAEQAGREIADKNWFSRAMTGLGYGLTQFAEGVQGFGRMVTGDDTIRPASVASQTQAYVRENLDGINRVMWDVSTTTGNMAPSILLASLTGAAASGLGAGASAATTAAHAAGGVGIGVGAAGNAYTQAINEGKSAGEAAAYGLLIGASEATLETLLGGIEGISSHALARSAIGAKAVGAMDNVVKLLSSHPVVQRLISAGARYLGDAGSEFLEEYLQTVLEPAFRNVCFDENNEIKLFSSEALYDGLLGALSAGLMNLPHFMSDVYGIGYDARINRNKSIEENYWRDLMPDAANVDFKIGMFEDLEAYRARMERELALYVSENATRADGTPLLLKSNPTNEATEASPGEDQNNSGETRPLRPDYAEPSAPAAQERSNSGTASGVTAVIGGETVQITGVSGKQGARSFTASDGSTASMGDVDAKTSDPSARLVLTFANNVDSEGAAQAAINNYTPGTDAAAYTRGIYDIYKAATGEADFDEAVAAAGENASALSRAAQLAAYRAGLVDAGATKSSAPAVQLQIEENVPAPNYDVSTSSITQGKDLSAYSPEKQRSVQEYLNAVDEGLLEFVEDAISETDSKRLAFMHRDFGNILPDHIYKKIESLLDFNVRKYQITINGETVHHIKNGHDGSVGASNNTMSDDRDIARIEYVLANADSVDYAYDEKGNRVFDYQYRDKDNKPSIVLAVSKRIDGTYIVGTVAADSKAKTLRIKTAFTTQKRSGQESLPNNDLKTYVRNDLASASESIVSQNEQGVKEKAVPSPQSPDGDSSPSPQAGEADGARSEVAERASSSTTMIETPPAAVEAKAPPKVSLADMLSKRETRRRTADFNAAVRKITDPAVRDMTGRLTRAEKAVLTIFADAFGVDITYLAELPDGAFGSIVSYVRSISVSEKSPNKISTTVHEIVHLFRAMDPERYDDLRDIALHALEKNGADLDELIDRQLELHDGEDDFDTDAAVEEVVANSFGDGVQNAPDFVDRIIRFAAEDGYGAKKTKTLLDTVKRYFEQLKAFFERCLEKVRERLGRTAVTREGIYLQRDIEACDAMLDAFLDAGKKLNEKYRAYVESDEEKLASGGKSEKKQILYTKDNKPYVVIEKDILSGIPKEQWGKTVRDTLRVKFPEPIKVGPNFIRINSDSRGELTNGPTQKTYLRKAKRTGDYTTFMDRYNALVQSDELLFSAEWINTGLNHKRNDNVIDFANGTVLIEVHGRKYSAEVEVALTDSGVLRLHDLVKINPASFTKKENTSAFEGPLAEAGMPISDVSSDNSIHQPTEKVNTQNTEKRQLGEDPAALDELERELAGEREKVSRLEKKSEAQEATIRALSHALSVEPDRIPSYKDVGKLAKELIKGYSSKLDAGKLQSKLNAVCERFRRGNVEGNGDYTSVYQQISGIAAEIVDSAEAVVGDSPAWKEGYDDFLRTMRSGIRLTENQRQEIGARYDGFENWRRSHFGKINVTSDPDAVRLDMIWDTLLEYVPDMLPAASEISEGDMALEAAELADKLSNRKKETYNPFFFDVFEGAEVRPLTDIDRDVERSIAIDGVTHEILSGIADVGDVKSVRAAESEGYARARDEFNNRLSDLRRETLKERNDWRVAMAADKNAAIEEYRQARQLTELRDKSTRLLKKMSRALLEPTKTNYVPRGLYEASIGALEAIDVGLNLTTRAGQQLQTMRERLTYLKHEYEALKGSDDPDFATEYDSHFSDMITRLTEEVGDVPIRKMSFEQLSKVYSLLKEIDGLITDARLQIAAGEMMENHDLGMRMVEETEKAAPKFKRWREYSGATLNVVRLANMIGGYDPESVIVKQVGELVNGVRKRDFFIMRHTKPFEDLQAEAKKYGYKSFDAWRSETIDVGLVDTDGKPVKLTRPQIMQIVMTHQREAASGGKLEHLWRGGINVPDLRQILKGNKAEAMENMRHVEHVSREDVSRMMKHIGEYESRWIELARNFFNGDSYKALNEVWRVLRHTEMPKSRDYIPYRVDKNYVTSDIPGLMYNASLDNAGYLKNTQTHAPQPLIIMGLDVVVNEHIEDVGKQVGLAIPLRNLNKVYNARDVASGKSVKGTLAKYWKTGKANDVIAQAMADLQTGRVQDYNWASKALGKLRTGYIQKTLNMNLSVAMSQAASYFAAGAEISPAVIQEGLARLPYAVTHQKKLWNEIDTYTAQNWIRRRGLSSVELGDLSKIQTFADKLPSWMTGAKWIQAIDVLTTTWLWDVTKMEINRQIKKGDLKLERGSGEYWAAVTELYDRIIEGTQPMYDPLYRPELLKSTNMLSRTMFMFKTQPMQNHGILFDAAGNLAAVHERYKGDKSEDAKRARAEARRRFNRAAWSQINSAVVFRGMKVLCMLLLFKVGMLRDDDGEVTADSIWKATMKDFGADLAGTLAPVATAFGAYDNLRNAFEGNFKDFGLEINVPESQMVGNMYNSFGKIFKAIISLSEESEKEEKSDNVFFSMAGPIWDAVKELASFNGIPLANAAGYANAVRNWFIDIKNGDFGKFEAAADEHTAAQYFRLAYKAYLEGDTAKADNYKKQTELNLGKTPDTIDAGIRKLIKENAEENGMQELLEAFVARDFDAFTQKMDELTGKFPEKYVEAVLKSLYEDTLPEGEKKEKSGFVNIFKPEYIAEAFVDGDVDALEFITGWYADAGKDFPKGNVTTAMKAIWNDLSDEERERTASLLVRYGGYKRYGDGSIAEWYEDYQKVTEYARDSLDFVINGKFSEAVKTADTSMKAKYNEYVEKGDDPESAKEKASSTVKKKLNEVFKPAYIASDSVTRQKIRNALSYYTDLDGGKLYGSYSEITEVIEKWMKGANK